MSNELVTTEEVIEEMPAAQSWGTVGSVGAFADEGEGCVRISVMTHLHRYVVGMGMGGKRREGDDGELADGDCLCYARAARHGPASVDYEPAGVCLCP